VVVSDAIGRCAGAVIAVKPQDVAPAIGAAVAAGARRVLSIAAGVTVAALEAAATDPGVAGWRVPLMAAKPAQSYRNAACCKLS
jgi:pyrroline-5-carboxylate reductase